MLFGEFWCDDGRHGLMLQTEAGMDKINKGFKPYDIGKRRLLNNGKILRLPMRKNFEIITNGYDPAVRAECEKALKGIELNYTTFM